MIKQQDIPSIPFVYILIYLISKEIFSYDSEKVVILCILCFILLAYYQIREGINTMFEARTIWLHEEFLKLLKLKIDLLRNIKHFWSTFTILEKNILSLIYWIKYNLNVFNSRLNKNRKLLIMHFIKDNLNFLLKNKSIFIGNIKKLNTNKFVKNYNNLLETKINFFDKSSNLTSSTVKESHLPHFTDLLLNKLNFNKEILLNSSKLRKNTIFS